MASRTRTNLQLVGILFVAAGVLRMLALLLGWFAQGAGATTIFAISNLAFGGAFLLLALRKVGDTLGQAAFWVAAVGWFLLAVSAPFAVNTFGQTALVVALAGTLGSGLVVYVGRLFTRQAAVAFLVATILGALTLLDAIAGFLPGLAGAVVAVGFSVVAVVTGLSITQRR